MGERKIFDKIGEEIIRIEEDALRVTEHFFHRHKDRKEGLFLSQVTINNITIKGIIMSLQMSKLDFSDALIAPYSLAADGVTHVPSTVQDGSVTFSVPDGSVVTLEQDPNNQLGVRITGVADGTVTLSYSGKAASGAVISGSDTITISDAPPPPPPTPDAVGFDITYGAPQPQAAPAS